MRMGPGHEDMEMGGCFGFVKGRKGWAISRALGRWKDRDRLKCSFGWMGGTGLPYCVWLDRWMEGRAGWLDLSAGSAAGWLLEGLVGYLGCKVQSHRVRK